MMGRLRFIIATVFFSLALLTVAGDALASNHGGAAGGAAAPSAPAGSLMGRLRRVGGATGADLDRMTSATSFAEIVGKIINGAMGLLGVIFVAQMVYAGYLWMTASGEEEQLTKAKNIIRRSIVGLTIVLAAWAITNFVLYRLTAATGVR